MPLGLRDITPFLTPYTSPADWAQLHAKQVGQYVDAKQGLLRLQAQKELARQQAEQARLKREDTLEWHKSQLKQQQKKQETEADQRAQSYLSDYLEAGEYGKDPAKAAVMEPFLSWHGIHRIPIQPPTPPPPPTQMAEVPNVSIGMNPFMPNLGAGVNPTPGVDPGGAPEYAADQPIPTAQMVDANQPPAPPAPLPTKFAYMRNGKPMTIVDTAETARARQMASRSVLDPLMQATRPVDQPMQGPINDAAEALPVPPTEAFKIAQSGGHQAAQMASQERRSAASAAAAAGRYTQQQAEVARRDREEEAKHGERAERQLQRVDKQLGASQEANGFRTLRSAASLMEQGRATRDLKIYNQIGMMIADERNHGRITDRDFEAVPAVEGWPKKIELWLNKKLQNKVSPAEYADMERFVNELRDHRARTARSTFQRIAKERDTIKTSAGRQAYQNFLDRNYSDMPWLDEELQQRAAAAEDAAQGGSVINIDPETAQRYEMSPEEASTPREGRPPVPLIGAVPPGPATGSLPSPQQLGGSEKERAGELKRRHDAAVGAAPARPAPSAPSALPPDRKHKLLAEPPPP